jgi:hypothetical protein
MEIKPIGQAVWHTRLQPAYGSATWKSSRELGHTTQSLPESDNGQMRGTRLVLRAGSSLTGTSAQRQASPGRRL